MQARLIASAIVAVAVASAAAVPADAAPKRKPKPISGSKKVSDFPDPTGSHPDSGAGCDTMLPSQLPKETPITLKIPGAGKINVSLDNKLDWAIEIRDPKGNIIAGVDGGLPQDQEVASAKTKLAGTYKIFACNLGGEPEVTATYKWTPA